MAELTRDRRQRLRRSAEINPNALLWQGKVVIELIDLVDELEAALAKWKPETVVKEKYFLVTTDTDTGLLLVEPLNERADVAELADRWPGAIYFVVEYEEVRRG